MAVYFLVDIRDVTDGDKLALYRSGVLATVEAHGGRYLVLGGPAETVEGTWTFGTPVLLEFLSRIAFDAWYSSADYEPLLELRLGSTTGAALLLDGCEHPPPSLVSPG
ncbi:DUF1330 domain-containing protein [Mangrovicoccus ximenensis]|uniref:DUF1330 domain-containing protein n=1 Tax=Mangrovicoccus ximenensis TaxID=1911570 RepID=UPI0013749FF7|nr:DUF1330 domain-containing protein [Mangrovicoccus ximenensis]